MKKYIKEIIIFLFQIFIFYLFPKSMDKFGPFGIVFIILLTTFILSLIIGCISENKIKYYYPLIISLIFIPTIYIYYNESALIHSLWYLVISSLGLIIGIILKKYYK